MRYLPDAKQMKTADSFTINELKIPSLELMERAARACVNHIKDWKINLNKICVLCGSGNNGGDGFAIARMFAWEGYDVTAVLVGNRDHCTPETAHQIEQLKNTGAQFKEQFEQEAFESEPYTLIIDAIFGVGLCREVGGRYAQIIECVNQSDAVRMSVDIPSGICATTGNVLGTAVRADYTVTIQETKVGLVLDPGRSYAGICVSEDIGIVSLPLERDEETVCTLEGSDYAALLPKRNADSNKGTYGKLLMITGSKGMSGAAYLGALAAYRTGTGLVQIYTAKENRVILQSQIPEAIITTYEKYDVNELHRLIDWADVVAIGSGLGTKKTARKILKETIAYTKKPCVIDADGLNILSEHMEYLCGADCEHFIFTPHMKEFERISGLKIAEVKKDRIAALRTFVKEYGVTCVLKDSRTTIANPRERAVVNLSGCAAMAKAGSGDVLAGIIASYLAQGLSEWEAALLGVYIHGRAGEIIEKEQGAYSLLARELAQKAGTAMTIQEEN
ncbi:NAD(P)H-hydrate dehydratase [Dorea formicigenerans]|uniref:Bifunctional NAD(P)H-hydrate repair enzyme n=1 Tax=Dorea formicigenerans TaxID=39486 RepID=A0A414QJ79_9FIRM|nr:NAD(P)H-hydrate dehydratase [Dorea formicigenerans]RHF80836.1 NAD(P)H-hydrate dehydratase [Dorea formicigenerans]